MTDYPSLRRGRAHPQVLQRRVEPLAILAQALLAVIDVPVDLDDLGLEDVPVRLEGGEHIDEIALGVLRTHQNARVFG